MKNKTMLTALVPFALLSVLITTYFVNRPVVSRPQSPQLVGYGRLMEQIKVSNAKEYLEVRESNRLTEESTQRQLAQEASRLDKLGIKGQ